MKVVFQVRYNNISNRRLIVLESFKPHLNVYSQVWWSSAAEFHISRCCDEHLQTWQKLRWLQPAALAPRWQKTHPRTLKGHIFRYQTDQLDTGAEINWDIWWWSMWCFSLCSSVSNKRETLFKRSLCDYSNWPLWVWDSSKNARSSLFVCSISPTSKQAQKWDTGLKWQQQVNLQTACLIKQIRHFSDYCCTKHVDGKFGAITTNNTLSLHPHYCYVEPWILTNSAS